MTIPTDNARIVRDALAYLKEQSGKYDDYRSFETESEAWERVDAALTALETELSDLKAELARAREEERERIIALITDRHNEIPWLTPIDQRESIHADPRTIRAALAPEQKG